MTPDIPPFRQPKYTHSVYYLCAIPHLFNGNFFQLPQPALVPLYQRGSSCLLTFIFTFGWRLNIRQRESYLRINRLLLPTNYLLSPLTKLTKPYLIFGLLNYILIYLPIQPVIQDYNEKLGSGTSVFFWVLPFLVLLVPFTSHSCRRFPQSYRCRLYVYTENKMYA